MSDVALMERPGEVIAITPDAAFLPVAWERIEQVANMLCGAPGLVSEFKDMAVCRFVAYQASRAHADPVAFATEVYFVPRKGGGLVVGYGAKLIHALINQNAPITQPLQFRYGYSNPNQPTVMNRFCEVVGMLRGASEPSRLVTPTVGQVKTKNSPTWFSDPDQQLSYMGVRNWARRFCPEVILGMYSREEIQEIAHEHEPRRALFEEDEPGDAEFDGIPPAEPQDARPASDAPKSAQIAQSAQADTEPPPGGTLEPDDLPDVRAWVAAEQSRIMKLTDPAAVTEGWNELAKADQFKRLVAYDQALANTVKAAIRGHLEKVKRNG